MFSPASIWSQPHVRVQERTTQLNSTKQQNSKHIVPNNCFDPLKFWQRLLHSSRSWECHLWGRNNNAKHTWLCENREKVYKVSNSAFACHSSYCNKNACLCSCNQMEQFLLSKNTDTHSEVILTHTNVAGEENKNRYSWVKTEAIEVHGSAEEPENKIHLETEVWDTCENSEASGLHSLRINNNTRKLT